MRRELVVAAYGARSVKLEFELDADASTRFVAPAGSYVVKPRGRQHTFWNKTDEPVRYIELSGGAGFQGFVDASNEVGALEATRQSADDYDIRWHYERIPGLMIENCLTKIAGFDAPWEQLSAGGPKEVLARLREGVKLIAGCACTKKPPRRACAAPSRV